MSAQRKKPDCVAYPRSQGVEPRTVADFINKISAVLEDVSLSTLDESTWWEEYLIWMKQFELHVQASHPLKARVLWELQRIKGEVILYRAVQSDSGHPISIAEMEGFLKWKLQSRIRALNKLTTFVESHQM